MDLIIFSENYFHYPNSIAPIWGACSFCIIASFILKPETHHQLRYKYGFVANKIKEAIIFLHPRPIVLHPKGMPIPGRIFREKMPLCVEVIARLLFHPELKTYVCIIVNKKFKAIPCWPKIRFHMEFIPEIVPA